MRSAAMAAAGLLLVGCSGTPVVDQPAAGGGARDDRAGTAARSTTAAPSPHPGQRRGQGAGSTTRASAAGPGSHPGAAARQHPGTARVRAVRAMSLRQLAHQLLVVPVAGTSPTRVSPAAAAANRADFGVSSPAQVARSFQPGGFVYFDPNVVDVAQVRALSRGLHRASRRAGVASLLGTDQEGGLVSRLPGPAVDAQPSARDLGADPARARASAVAVGRAMSDMGLDVDFAPVADVDTVDGAGVIGDRAFGTTPEVVGPMVRAQTCGYHQGGVAVTLKHWPGHGSTPVDSHQQLPTVSISPARWRREHLPPFVQGIAGGADLVMTGHLAYPRLDPSGQPATLSRRLTHGWLRERLGFDGVVVTDSLQMAAVSEGATSGTLAVAALRAGADLLLMPASPQGATSGIRAAVADGTLTRARLERSALRILALKDATGLVDGRRTLSAC